MLHHLYVLRALFGGSLRKFVIKLINDVFEIKMIYSLVGITQSLLSRNSLWFFLSVLQLV